jgi:hypothetical protein
MPYHPPSLRSIYNALHNRQKASVKEKHVFTVIPKSCDSSVGIALGYWLDDRGSSRPGLGICLFTTASRTSSGPIQPPVQGVPGALSLGVKRPEREADHSPPSSAEVKE